MIPWRETASLGDTQGIFEGIRSNALHVTAHYILLTGFLCMAAGSIGVALSRLGLLGQTRHRGVTGGGKNFLAVVLLGVVPLFGAMAADFVLTEGLVMRLAASRLLENSGDPAAALAMANIITEGMSQLTWVLMFWAGVVPLLISFVVEPVDGAGKVVSRLVGISSGATAALLLWGGSAMATAGANIDTTLTEMYPVLSSAVVVSLALFAGMAWFGPTPS